MNEQLYTLRNISTRMGILPLREMALLPGTRGVFRITIYYDGKAADSIATLRRTGSTAFEVVYGGRFGHKPISYPFSLSRYDEFAAALQKLRFDHLSDQENIPFYGTNIWLVERAAGGFLKSVVFSSDSTLAPYRQLMDVVRQYLPEAVREIR